VGRRSLRGHRGDAVFAFVEELMPVFMMTDAVEAGSVCSLSHRERDGVRGSGLSISLEPPHPRPLPDGERERTERAAPFGQSDASGGRLSAPSTSALAPGKSKLR